MHALLRLRTCMNACTDGMCACTYTCMHTCTHARVHVCMYSYTDARTYAFMNVCTYACMNVCMHACKQCTHVCMYACMHVCSHHIAPLRRRTLLYLNYWVPFCISRLCSNVSSSRSMFITPTTDPNDDSEAGIKGIDKRHFMWNSFRLQPLVNTKILHTKILWVKFAGALPVFGGKRYIDSRESNRAI